MRIEKGHVLVAGQLRSRERRLQVHEVLHRLADDDRAAAVTDEMDVPGAVEPFDLFLDLERQARPFHDGDAGNGQAAGLGPIKSNGRVIALCQKLRRHLRFPGRDHAAQFQAVDHDAEKMFLVEGGVHRSRIFGDAAVWVGHDEDEFV